MKGAWKAKKKGASCHQALVLWGFLSTGAASRRGYETPPPPTFEVFFLLGVRAWSLRSDAYLVDEAVVRKSPVIPANPGPI